MGGRTRRRHESGICLAARSRHSDGLSGHMVPGRLGPSRPGSPHAAPGLVVFVLASVTGLGLGRFGVDVGGAGVRLGLLAVKARVVSI